MKIIIYKYVNCALLMFISLKDLKINKKFWTLLRKKIGDKKRSNKFTAKVTIEI